jgi:hypothetical protein
MRELADFLRWVMPYATACPEPVAESHILDAAREFCAATRCWRFVDTIVVKADDRAILCVPPGASLHEIEEARFAGRSLDRIAYTDIDHGEGEPHAISQIDMNSVALVPHRAGTLDISLFLTPAVHADQLPDILYDRWARTIADGALASILELPGQPYTDVGAAAARRARFEQAKDSNFNASKRGQQRAPVRTRPRFL